jgi:pilus assembly protein CpaF
MLKWLAQFIQSNLRIGVLETTYELALDKFLPQHNVICFEEQPRLGRTIVKQFHTMLRESPDVIVLGEARGQEADMMIKTFRRGHPGSMGTIHSNSPEAAIQDLADMIMEDGRNWDQRALYLRVARSIDVVIQLHLEHDTGIRRLWRVTEVDCPELADEVRFYDLIRYDPQNKKWEYPNSPGKRLLERFFLYGVEYPERKPESEKERVLAWSL